jgi:hypothetical protein
MKNYSRDVSFESDNLSLYFTRDSTYSNHNFDYTDEPLTTVLTQSNNLSHSQENLDFSENNVSESDKMKFFSEKKISVYNTTTASDSNIQKDPQVTNNVDCCNCKKNHCLKLYCSCFKKLGFCSDQCKCNNCLNTTKFNQARNFVIQKTKIISQNAFNKFVFYKNNEILRNGCKCKKGCHNNYCECKKNKKNCSSICRCSDLCCNSPIVINKEEIKTIYKHHPRKKKKITINFFDMEKDPNHKKIVFDNY